MSGRASGRFEIFGTALAGTYALQRQPREDERGWLERMFCADDLADVIGERTIAQVNRSLTRSKATVRGMHYQVAPSAEAKLVSCLRGEIFDVAVDVRRGSPTFLQWHGEVLNAENRRSLFIPEGVAHGFQALADDSEILYFTTAAYDSMAERGLHPMDPWIGIEWPLAIGQLSARDAAHPPIDAAFDGILV